MPRLTRVAALAIVAFSAIAGSPAAHADDRERAETLNRQMMLLYGQGQYAAAVPLASEIVAIFEKDLGPNSPEVASALNNLAELQAKQNHVSDAEALYRRSLAIRSKRLGPTHPDTIKSLNRLAELYRSAGRDADAAALFAAPPKPPEAAPPRASPPPPRAVSASEAKDRERSKDADRARDLYDQALHLNQQGRNDEAIPLAEQALGLYEKVFGADTIAIIGSIDNLAQLQMIVRQYALAEPLFRRSLAITEKARGPDHPDVARALFNVAEAVARQNRYADAEALYQRSLAIREKILGQDHPDTAAVRVALNELRARRAWETGAELPAKDRQAIRDLVVGPKTDQAVVQQSVQAADLARRTVLDQQLQGLLTQEHYGEALPVARELQALLEKTLGPDNLAVALNLDTLATIATHLGHLAEAEAYAKRSQAIRDKARAAEHKDSARP